MPESVANRGFDYRAFISYSHQDKTWADWLHKALETYRVPSRLVGTHTAAGVIPRRLHPIFRDRDELASAHDLSGKVNAALAKSQNLIVICSPRSAASRWVNEEVLAFKRLGHSERIFCLIVDGEPNASDIPGREGQECFAPALRFQIDANGQPTSERTEPIAADARAGKDGKANAKLKLIAGMLDVGFDKLKQRELQRRNRRMTAITALALLVMAVTTVLAINAVIARRAAQVAQQAAERRQKQAEGLVDFMLGDLNDKLSQVSRLDIMQSVDDKAMAYFASLPATDVTDEALAQRAKALEKIGVIRMGQGHLPQALESFRASTQISSRLATAAPADVARQTAFARTLSYIGMVYWTQGNLATAEENFESARKVLLLAQTHSKDDLSLKFELQDADNNIGHVLEAGGQTDAAAAAYRNTLELSRELVAADPKKSDWSLILGDAHNNLGKLALQRGDLATAVTEYSADNAIKTRLSERDPKNNDRREKTVWVHAILGRTLALTGDIQNGMRNLRQAVATAEELMKFDSTQTDYQDDFALYSAQLARLIRLDGDMTAANALTARSIAIMSALVHKDASNSGWQSDYAAVLTEQAAQSRAANQTDVARAQVQNALRILDPILAKNPDDRDTLLSAMTAKLLLADISTEPQAAQSLREVALKTMQAQKTSKGDPRLLALQVEALLALGRKEDVQPLIKQLWNSGYRDLALVNVLQRVRIDYPPNPDFQAKLLAASGRDDDETPPPAGNEAHK